jgi:hypothetical protein
MDSRRTYRVRSVRPHVLYEQALARQQRRRSAVVSRTANVIQLRDPWGIYDERGRLMLRIPHGSIPRQCDLAEAILDALLMLSAQAPEVYQTVAARGLRDGWLRADAGFLTIASPLPQMTAATVIAVKGHAMYMSPDAARDTFHRVGGLPRLVAWARENPASFADICAEVFRRAA